MQSQLSLVTSLPPSKPSPLLISKPLLSFRRARRTAVRAMLAWLPHDSAIATENMYDLLLVRETAGPEEIKAAFRRQARRWHPDACPSSGAKSLFAQHFMKARRAYEILSDPVLRDDYDSVLFGMKSKGRGYRCGLGDWKSQLEGLERRSSARAYAAASWSDRMRRAWSCGASD